MESKFDETFRANAELHSEFASTSFVKFVHHLRKLCYFLKINFGDHYFSQLLALPFLPGAHIAPTFAALKVRANTEPLQRLCAYIERQWIVSAQFPPASWSACQHHVRTNNDVEGTYMIFSTSVRNIYLFITLV